MLFLSSLHRVSMFFRQNWVDVQVHKLLARASQMQGCLTAVRGWYQVERRGPMGFRLFVPRKWHHSVRPDEQREQKLWSWKADKPVLRGYKMGLRR